jgi:hypothetical protein
MDQFAKLKDKTGGRLARMGNKIYAYRVLVEKPKGKRPFGRYTRRWQEHIKIYISKI